MTKASDLLSYIRPPLHYDEGMIMENSESPQNSSKGHPMEI